jgi:hypothetical protein
MYQMVKNLVAPKTVARLELEILFSKKRFTSGMREIGCLTYPIPFN